MASKWPREIPNVDGKAQKGKLWSLRIMANIPVRITSLTKRIKPIKSDRIMRVIFLVVALF